MWKPHTSSAIVVVVPASVLKQRKPLLGDVIYMPEWRWDEVKNSGLYKRAELHPDVRRLPNYPAPMADVVDPGAVDIYIPGA